MRIFKRIRRNRNDGRIRCDSASFALGGIQNFADDNESAFIIEEVRFVERFFFDIDDVLENTNRCYFGLIERHLLNRFDALAGRNNRKPTICKRAHRNCLNSAKVDSCNRRVCKRSCRNVVDGCAGETYNRNVLRTVECVYAKFFERDELNRRDAAVSERGVADNFDAAEIYFDTAGVCKGIVADFRRVRFIAVLGCKRNFRDLRCVLECVIRNRRSGVGNDDFFQFLGQIIGNAALFRLIPVVVLRVYGREQSAERDFCGVRKICKVIAAFKHVIADLFHVVGKRDRRDPDAITERARADGKPFEVAFEHDFFDIAVCKCFFADGLNVAFYRNLSDKLIVFERAVFYCVDCVVEVYREFGFIGIALLRLVFIDADDDAVFDDEVFDGNPFCGKRDTVFNEFGIGNRFVIDACAVRAGVLNFAVPPTRKGFFGGRAFGHFECQRFVEVDVHVFGNDNRFGCVAAFERNGYGFIVQNRNVRDVLFLHFYFKLIILNFAFRNVHELSVRSQAFPAYEGVIIVVRNACRNAEFGVVVKRFRIAFKVVVFGASGKFRPSVPTRDDIDRTHIRVGHCDL